MHMEIVSSLFIATSFLIILLLSRWLSQGVYYIERISLQLRVINEGYNKCSLVSDANLLKWMLGLIYLSMKCTFWTHFWESMSLIMLGTTMDRNSQCLKPPQSICVTVTLSIVVPTIACVMIPLTMIGLPFLNCRDSTTPWMSSAALILVWATWCAQLWVFNRTLLALIQGLWKHPQITLKGSIRRQTKWLTGIEQSLLAIYEVSRKDV